MMDLQRAGRPRSPETSLVPATPAYVLGAATRQGWSERSERCGKSNEIRICRLAGERPARPRRKPRGAEASLATATVTSSAMRRHASERARFRASLEITNFRVPSGSPSVKAATFRPRRRGRDGPGGVRGPGASARTTQAPGRPSSLHEKFRHDGAPVTNPRAC